MVALPTQESRGPKKSPANQPPGAIDSLIAPHSRGKAASEQKGRDRPA
jgi:hypothetical protein